MRVLATTQPGSGHLARVAAVALVLRARGHEVEVASAPAFGPAIAARGLPHVPAGLDWVQPDLRTTFPGLPERGPELGAAISREVFAGATVEPMARDVLAHAASRPPDLIVRDTYEFGGALAAELLGVPQAALSTYPGHLIYERRHDLLAGLHPARERFGLAPDPGLDAPYRHLGLVGLPPAYDPAARFPESTRHVRLEAAAQPIAPASRRPLVLVSLGSILHERMDVLETLVRAAAAEPVDLVVATGTEARAQRLRGLAPEARLAPWVDQRAELARAAALVTHGGSNSVREALTAGVPMVIVPLMADQPYHARRCADLGVATVVHEDDCTVTAVRRALRAVLDDPGYRRAAARMRADTAALPGPDEVTTMVESVVARAGSH